MIMMDKDGYDGHHPHCCRHKHQDHQRNLTQMKEADPGAIIMTFTDNNCN